jgi:hypothetical protein
MLLSVGLRMILIPSLSFLFGIKRRLVIMAMYLMWPTTDLFDRCMGLNPIYRAKSLNIQCFPDGSFGVRHIIHYTDDRQKVLP